MSWPYLISFLSFFWGVGFSMMKIHLSSEEDGLVSSTQTQTQKWKIPLYFEWRGALLETLD